MIIHIIANKYKHQKAFIISHHTLEMRLTYAGKTKAIKIAKQPAKTRGRRKTRRCNVRH